jgi:hypothetical protein
MFRCSPGLQLELLSSPYPHPPQACRWALDSPFSLEIKPMDSPLTHPYALQRRCRSVSTLSPATRSTHGPADSEKNLGLWHPSTETEHGSVTAFVSVMGPPSNKLDVSPPAMPVHEYPYVKHNSGITVILSGHRAGTSLPLYPSGSLISGVVVLSKVESITSLNVKVSVPFVPPSFPAVSQHLKLIFVLVGRSHLSSRNPGRRKE